jgi:Tfp pilus assembly protein PilN
VASISIFQRKDRHGVLLNLTDHCVQLARLTGLDEKPLGVDAFAEIPAGDEEAITRWLSEAFPDRSGGGYLPGYCSFHPQERLLLRETINPRRLVEEAYLPGLVAEHAKISSTKEWHMVALNASDGLALTPESTARAGLLLGVPWTAVRETQQMLRKWGIRPRRLEIGTLAMLGGLARHLSLTAYPHALVACEIAHAQTRIYLLGKDGVHTPPALPHGLLSIEEAAMKELGAPDVATARRHLEEPTDELRTHSRRLVRMLSRHLRPAVDYFEMQTGQRIGALFCTHLPARLGWLEQALSATVDLELFSPDFATWLPAVGLQTMENAIPDPSWFQSLSLVAQLLPGPPAVAAHDPKP